MKPSFLLIFCLAVGMQCSAQWSNVHGYLDTNQISAMFNANADMFYDFGQTSYFLVPKNTNVPKSTIFASALWIGGLDKNNYLHEAAMTYRQNGSDFWAGPLDTTTAKSDSTISLKYDYLWKISRADINAFLLDKSIIPPSFLSWPAHGDSAAHQARFLAPFLDADHDNKYNPAKGDYPKIEGDQALYWIFNDQNVAHTETKALPLGIEVQTMAYEYACGQDPLQYTVFLHYKIINRSANDYHDVYLGQWTDFDIGDGFDDYIGSDSSLQLFYGYNGEKTDLKYGTDVPAQGVLFLNRPLNVFTYYQNDFTVNGNPERDLHYYYYLQGKNKSGDYIDPYSRLMYNGDPVDSTGNTEYNHMNKPGDRRGLGATGPFSLKAGESLDFDIAFVTGFGAGDLTSNIKLMKKNAARLLDAYSKGDVSCETTSIQNTATKGPKFSMYPNPAGQLIHITTNSTGVVDIYGITGRKIKTFTVSGSSTLDVSNLSAGIYLLRLTTAHGQSSQKLIIQKSE
jgi:hypothetical protein